MSGDRAGPTVQPMTVGPVIDFVPVEAVRPLRLAVLRPGEPAEEAALPGDDHPLARHAAAIVERRVVAVGSILPDPPPWDETRPDSWRIRGMATDPSYRDRGLGGAVLQALLDYAVGAGGRFVWCNARVRARPFYERLGFVGRGETFLSRGVEHVAMWRDLPER